MAFQPVPNTCSATIHWNTTDTSWTNVLHFTRPDFNSTDMELLAASLGSEFLPTLLESFGAPVKIDQITMYDLRSETAPKYVLTFDPALDGDRAGDTPVAVNAALCVSLYGNGRGKWNQGRIYFAGIGEQVADERRVQDSIANAIVAAIQALVGGGVSPWTLTIVSRYLNGEKRAQAVTSPVVTVRCRSTMWTSQKRRISRP